MAKRRSKKRRTKNLALHTHTAKGLGFQIAISRHMNRKATARAWRKRITKLKRGKCIGKADAKRLRKLVHRMGVLARRVVKQRHRRGR